MESHFHLDARADGNAAVLTLRGELDLAASPVLEEELDKALGSKVPLVLVDLRQLDFMDSMGLSALVRAHQRAEQTGQRFVLVNGSPQVQRLLSLTGIAERMTLVDDPDDALRDD
ncbi:MAG TPA: STAS domain-containing protein [Solirubrobacteraceae bacterium]